MTVLQEIKAEFLSRPEHVYCPKAPHFLQLRLRLAEIVREQFFL